MHFCSCWIQIKFAIIHVAHGCAVLVHAACKFGPQRKHTPGHIMYVWLLAPLHTARRQLVSTCAQQGANNYLYFMLVDLFVAVQNADWAANPAEMIIGHTYHNKVRHCNSIFVVQHMM